MPTITFCIHLLRISNINQKFSGPVKTNRDITQKIETGEQFQTENTQHNTHH